MSPTNPNMLATVLSLSTASNALRVAHDTLLKLERPDIAVVVHEAAELIMRAVGLCIVAKAQEGKVTT